MINDVLGGVVYDKQRDNAGPGNSLSGNFPGSSHGVFAQGAAE